MSNKKNRQALVVMLESYRTQAEARLAAFAVEFAKDPLHALRWSSDTFEAATVQSIYGEVLRNLSTGASVTDIRKEIDGRVMQCARSAANLSTSAVANHTEAVRTAVLARLSGELDQWGDA